MSQINKIKNNLSYNDQRMTFINAYPVALQRGWNITAQKSFCFFFIFFFADENKPE